MRVRMSPRTIELRNALELAVRTRLVRRGEALADALRAGGLPRSGSSRRSHVSAKRDDATPGRGEEDRLQRGGEGRDVRRVHRRRQAGTTAGFAAVGTCTPARQSRRELVAEPVGEDRPEDRDADRAADLAEERRARRWRRRGSGSRPSSGRRARAPASPSRARARGSTMSAAVDPASACRRPGARAGRRATVISAVPAIGNGL